MTRIALKRIRQRLLPALLFRLEAADRELSPINI
jgi:hypothetical protein